MDCTHPQKSDNGYGMNIYTSTHQKSQLCSLCNLWYQEKFQEKSVVRKKKRLKSLKSCVVKKSMYHTHMFALEETTWNSYGN